MLTQPSLTTTVCGLVLAGFEAHGLNKGKFVKATCIVVRLVWSAHALSAADAGWQTTCTMRQPASPPSNDSSSTVNRLVGIGRRQAWQQAKLTQIWLCECPKALLQLTSMHPASNMTNPVIMRRSSCVVVAIVLQDVHLQWLFQGKNGFGITSHAAAVTMAVRC